MRGGEAQGARRRRASLRSGSFYKLLSLPPCVTFSLAISGALKNCLHFSDPRGAHRPTPPGRSLRQPACVQRPGGGGLMCYEMSRCHSVVEDCD